MPITTSLIAAPILDMRDPKKTREFYEQKLGFTAVGNWDDEYLIIQREHLFLHFTRYDTQFAPECFIYTDNLDGLYEEFKARGAIHPNGALETKPWGIREFAVIDPSENLLRFGELRLINRNEDAILDESGES